MMMLKFKISSALLGAEPAQATSALFATSVYNPERLANMTLFLSILLTLIAVCLSEKMMTSKEFQWRHDPFRWSLDRRAWLKDYEDFWSDYVVNSDLQLSGTVSLKKTWDQPEIQRYAYFDTADALVRQHSASLVLRQKILPVASDPTFTAKFNFRDWALARTFPITSKKKGRSKVEEDVYPCFSKYGRSDKIPVHNGFEPSSFADLKQYFEDPGQWFTATIDPVPSNINDMRLMKAGSPTYHYILSLPIKLGNIRTQITVTATYGTLQDAFMGGNATIVESGIRIVIGK